MPSQSPSTVSRRRHLLLALLFTCGTAFTLAAQQVPDSTPWLQALFDWWVNQGPVEQIPWETRAVYLGLSGHQRLLAEIDVELEIRELSKRPREGQMVFLVQVTDSAGHTYRNNGRLPLNELHEDAKKDTLRFSWRAFALPGEYQVTLALYHSVTGEHNLGHKTLRVPPLNHDALPQAWRELPAVEFLAPIPDSDIDFFFRPDIEGRLHLPLESRQPVHVQVLADFTTSDVFAGSHLVYLRYLSAVLPTLKTFSQIRVRDGSVDVATLDLTQRQVSFEQQDVKELDWPRLKKIFAGLDPGKISVQTLNLKHPTPGFLKEEVARRVSAKSGPLQVFIVITSPLGVYSFHGMNADPLPRDCNCVLYYLQYETSRRQVYFEAEGSVKKMFRPLRVRSFTGHNAHDLRHALAAILEEVSKM